MFSKETIITTLHPQEPPVRLPCARNIARKRDFCLFVCMRYSPLVISSVVLLSFESQNAYAVQCYDFDVAVLTLTVDMQALAQVQDSNETAFEKCNFYRIMGDAQSLKESMSKLNLYVDCPDVGPKVKAILSASEKFMTGFKVLGEKACADAGM